MFGISDLFQWERFITPSIIKVFYWLAVVISVLLGLAGVVNSLIMMAGQSGHRHDVAGDRACSAC